MRVAVVTSASKGTPWAEITLPNRLEYCVRHDYTMIVQCEPYQQALDGFGRLHSLLQLFDLVWTLDADCLITDLTRRIEDMRELGPHVSICEEGIGPHALVNGGSIVWRATHLSLALVNEIVESQPEWMPLEFNVQQWLMRHHERLADRLTICHTRAFNGVEHGKTKVWQHGDFVYHPCGAPAAIRCRMLRDHLQHVVR